MSDAKPLPRPRQVTVAGWAVVLASVFLLVTVFQSMSQLRSLESREAVAEFLSESPGNTVDMSVEAVLDLMHVAMLVAGGCAVAAAVLGFFALQRNRGARVGLTVLAPAILVSGAATGGLMSSVVVAAVVALWLQPARDWFAGREPRPVAPRPDAPRPVVERQDPPSVEGPGAAELPTVAPWGTPPTGGVEQEPRPYPGFGAPPAQAPTEPPPYPGPYGQQPPAAPYGQPGQPPQGYDPQGWAQPQAYGQPGQPGGQVRGPRPRPLLIAALLTWVFSGLSLLVTAASVAILAGDHDLILDEMRDTNPEIFDQQGVTEQLIVNTTYFMAGVLVLWSLAAIILAALALRGQGWARVMLIISASATAGFCLLGALTSVVLLLPVLAAGGTVYALLRPEVRAWFAAPRR